MTFRTQVGLLVAVLVALAVIVVGVTARVSAEQELVEEIDDFLISRSEVFDGPERGRRGLPGRIDPGALGAALRRPGDTDLAADDSIVQVVSPEGEIVANAGDVVLPVRTQVDEPYQLETVQVDDTEFRLISRPLNPGVTIQIARDLSETNEALRGLTRRLLVGGGALTVVAGLLGWLIGRRLTRPISQLTSATEEVTRTKDFDQPVDVAGSGEVSRLAESFNTMLDELGTSRAQQQRLIEDAGHELRTPLTSLRTNVELLQNPALADVDRQRVLARLQSEATELSTLVNEVVDLGTDSRSTEAFVPCDLVEVADAVAQRARRRHDRTIELTGVDRAPVIGQPQMLGRAVTNLVDNAIKFDGDGTISIDVGVDGVDVLDEGPGIPDTDIDLVFERFHRADTSRGVSGSGLGLSIVRQIADAHGGSVHAANRRDGGARVGFRIPVDRPGP